ncbi:MAG: hypothetical protein JXB35_09785 [Anaerolineae bacterium]|nr:hypothetical protein [Anaerolineae bacterium]
MNIQKKFVVVLLFMVLLLSSGGDRVHARFLAPEPGAGPEVGVEVVNPHLGNEIVISDFDNEELLPSVAYNWKHQEYFVVWHTTWGIGSQDIRGARISATGRLIDKFIVYEDATKDSAHPSVAYDPVHDRYLVVWVFDTFGNGSDWDLYGRLIPWEGPDPGLQDFVVCAFGTHQRNPKVAYGRAVEEFLVVWNNEFQAGTPPMYISGRRMTASNGTFPGSPSDLTVSHGSQSRVNPDVTYNLARNEYLVVYGNGADIFGIRLTGHLDHNFGGEFGIAGWPDLERYPAVAACEGVDQYFVTWESNQGAGNYAIYGRYIAGDGANGSVHQIDDTTGIERNSEVACNQAGTQYLVAWETEYVGGTFGIWSRVVHPNAVFEPQYRIVDPTSTKDRTEVVLVGGHTNYLAVWEHGRQGTPFQDIHGRLISPHPLFIPLAVRSYHP